MRLSILCLTVGALAAQTIDITDAGKLEPVRCQVESVTFKGKKAARVSGNTEGLNAFAVVKGIEFGDGEIELEVAGEPGPGAAAAARGFVGIAFRIDEDNKKFENIYLRPTNGRADDQVRRNHSVQYECLPDFPWSRLRKETPEKYESYVDLEPGVWTKMRIVVQGDKARLYVHGASQPTLIVNDLKLGAGAKGKLGLWIGPGTVGHFTALRVK